MAKKTAKKTPTNKASARDKLEKRLAAVSKNCLHGQPVPDGLRALWEAKLIGPKNQIHFPLHYTGFTLVSRCDKGFFEGYDLDTPTCRGHRRMFEEIAFFGQDDDHGLVGFWLYKPGLAVDKAPVLVLDSEGQYRVAAASLADYFVQAPFDNNYLKIKYTRGWFQDRGIKSHASEESVRKAVKNVPDPNARHRPHTAQCQGSKPMLEVTDDSGFLALVVPAAYETFVDSDWTLDQILAHFRTQMGRRFLLIWGTGLEGFWKVDLRLKKSKVRGVREASGPLQVVGGSLLLTNYESLTMAAQFEDVTLPEKHQEDLLVSLPDGHYTCRIIQMFDPEQEDTAGDEKADFVIEVLKATGKAAPWESIPWFQR